MNLAARISSLATRIATEIKAVRAEIAAASLAWTNMDGGNASSNYGGITAINGGNATGN